MNKSETAQCAQVRACHAVSSICLALVGEGKRESVCESEREVRAKARNKQD